MWKNRGNNISVKPATLILKGVLVPGYRVASGPSKDYPYGTLEKQKPFFKERGLNLDPYFEGTLNISIAPKHFTWVKQKYTFRGVAWTDMHPPEDFSFQPCRVKVKGDYYEGIIYYPHPQTKVRHFEKDDLIEVITTWVPGLNTGDRLEIEVEAGVLELTGPGKFE
jgi:CTP-dependent riboflavin kinase